LIKEARQARLAFVTLFCRDIILAFVGFEVFRKKSFLYDSPVDLFSLSIPGRALV
jgi:hypothetical protein